MKLFIIGLVIWSRCPNGKTYGKKNENKKFGISAFFSFIPIVVEKALTHKINYLSSISSTPPLTFTSATLYVCMCMCVCVCVCVCVRFATNFDVQAE